MPDLLSKQIDEHTNKLEKELRLVTKKSLTNMNLFTHKHRLKKYDSVYDIIDDYYKIRLLGYVKRKKYQIKNLEYETKKLTNKARFILEQCEDIIDLRKKKKNEVIELLKSRNYDVIDEDNEYKYLRTMRIEQVEEENMQKLLKEKDNKMKELEILKKTSEKTIWKKELKELSKQVEKYRKERLHRMTGRKVK